MMIQQQVDDGSADFINGSTERLEAGACWWTMKAAVLNQASEHQPVGTRDREISPTT